MTSNPNTKTAVGDGEARRGLKQELARLNCRVHQPEDPPLFTREPRSAMRAMHWRWRDLEPLLERIGAEIDLASGGPRRTLRLANPGLEYGTTHTFWASLQVILPGEVATTHRHSASALRFIMRGSGATTTVDGTRYPMSAGDLVLTPAGTWHDHIHNGDALMMWLDVLDISLMRALHASFFEGYPQEVQPVTPGEARSCRDYGSAVMGAPRGDARPASNPLLAYPRECAEAALARIESLAPDPYDDAILEYQNPETGSAAMTTLAMTLQKLRPGFSGRARRHTGSKLYYVVRGNGSSVVGGQSYDWNAGDFLAVPPWTWYSHANPGNDEATLFSVDDVPAMRALGYFREEKQ